MCGFNAKQTPRTFGRPALRRRDVWSRMKNGSRGARADAVGVISAFQGINPRSFLFVRPRLTPGRPRHNKRAKEEGEQTDGGAEIKTEG